MLHAAFPPSARLVYWSSRRPARSRRAARAGVLAFPPAEAISALRVEGADVRRGHDQVPLADSARAYFARERDLTVHGLRDERADARVIGGERKVELVRREHPGIGRREDEEPSRCRMDRGARARQRGAAAGGRRAAEPAGGTSGARIASGGAAPPHARRQMTVGRSSRPACPAGARLSPNTTLSPATGAPPATSPDTPHACARVNTSADTRAPPIMIRPPSRTSRREGARSSIGAFTPRVSSPIALGPYAAAASMHQASPSTVTPASSERVTAPSSVDRTIQRPTIGATK